MAHTNYTLALTPDWDLQVGANGSLATLRGIDATLQNVANECRCFKNGLYYYQDHGIPWIQEQLGQKLHEALVLARLRSAARFVVDDSNINDIKFKQFDTETRTFHGIIDINTEAGNGTVEI